MDVIATEYADGISPELYNGLLQGYGIDVIRIDIAPKDVGTKADKKLSKSRSQTKAYSYISMIKGEIQTHSTWAECEKRVKGISGTRFKKALQ